MPGLKFYKLDLHTHTPASKCYLHKEHTPDQIVQSAINCGLSAIAITDHNTAEWIDAMKAAAANTKLVIFPGVEVSLNEGYHLIALFDPSGNQEHVESFLGAIDITPEEYGKQEAVCTKGVYEVIKKIHERQGLAILAHIDCVKGAFHEQAKPRDDGKINVPVHCSKLFNEAEYDAVECTGGRLPSGFDSDHQIQRLPAIYQASDNRDTGSPSRHSVDGLGAPCTWFKLDQIELEGLRQCFADPEVRIRLLDEKQDFAYAKVVSLRVGNSGFLRNQALAFHDGLNSIIGGKGVGKSLAVEFLRFGLGQPSSDANLAADLLGKLEKRLETGNTVEVVYELADGTQYRIEQTYLGKEKCLDRAYPRSHHKCTDILTGEEYSGDITQMFPILAYSQTEVIKIAENKSAQLELIDRFIDIRQYEQEVETVKTLLKDNDSQLSKAIRSRDLLASCEVQINTLTAKIEAINRSLADPLFDAMKAAEAKKQAYEARQDFVGDLGTRVSGWHAEVEGSTVEPLLNPLGEDAALKEQQAAAENARSRVIEGLQGLVSELKTAKRSITNALTEWMPSFDKTAADYNELLKKIGGDRQAKEKERRSLETDKSKIEKGAQTYRALTNGLPDLLKRRNELLDRLEKAYRDQYEVRKAKFDQLTELSDCKLQLSLEHAADRSSYEKNLGELLRGGQNSPGVADRQRIAANIASRRLVQLVLDRDVQRLSAETGVSELWTNRSIEKLWSSDDFTQVLALQHNCHPGDIPTIRFRKEGSQYEELNELSVGQKCTALLIIALCDGTMPVVIDQPEDALDVISVWEDIAQKLRRGKSSRQFILTTHNSTVAVAADSDQFVVLTASANHGKVVAVGAIDRLDVRKAVIEHLEGGSVPYMLRSGKYNIAKLRDALRSLRS